MVCHKCNQIEYQMNCSGLEIQEILRYLTLGQSLLSCQIKLQNRVHFHFRDPQRKSNASILSKPDETRSPSGILVNPNTAQYS